MYNNLSTAEEITLIILSVLFIGLVTCLIIWRVKKYYVDESVSGAVLWTSKKSPEIVIKNTAVCIVCAGLYCLRVLTGHTEGYQIITSGVLAVQIICMAILAMQPYKVCKKGIITEQGFIEWEMIRKIMEAPKDDRVRLKLKRQMDNEISIYCQKEDVERMGKYIWERIGEE